jgi:hypothetical protein
VSKRSAGLVWMCIGTALITAAFIRYVAGGHPVLGAIVVPLVSFIAWIAFFTKEWGQRQVVHPSMLGSVTRYDGNAWHLVVAGAFMLAVTILVNEPTVAGPR